MKACVLWSRFAMTVLCPACTGGKHGGQFPSALQTRTASAGLRRRRHPCPRRGTRCCPSPPPSNRTRACKTHSAKPSAHRTPLSLRPSPSCVGARRARASARPLPPPTAPAPAIRRPNHNVSLWEQSQPAVARHIRFPHSQPLTPPRTQRNTHLGRSAATFATVFASAIAKHPG